MRIASFIFIVYIVLLLTQPCQDMLSMLDQSAGTEITHIESPTDKNDHTDGCSPFCICGCCSISVADSSTSDTKATTSSHTAVSQHMSEYTSPDTTTFQNSIWQPPKA